MRSLDRAFKSRLNGTGLKPLVQYIKDLFNNNEQGVWYDPSDLSTLYQDAAGTIPVTAVEQPVGLMLDKSRGLVLGPELFAGAYQTGASTTATYVGNEATTTFGGQIDATSSNWLSIPGKAEPGAVAVEFWATWVSGGNLGVGRTYTLGKTITAASNAGVRTKYTAFINSSFSVPTNGRVTFGASSAGSVWKIELISVRELPGAHASQTTATSRPVLSARVNLLTETEFRNGITDASVRSGGLVTAATMPGYLGALAFGYDGTTATYVYKNNSALQNVTQIIRVVVRMDDGLPPAFGSTEATTDFLFVIGGAYWGVSPTDYQVKNLGAGLYAVSAVMPVGSIIANNSGVVKMVKNSSRTFKVTAYDLRPANTGTNLPDYQRVNTNTDYDTVGFPKYIRYDNIDDVSNVKFPTTLGSNCTIARGSVGGSSTILTGQSIGDTYGINMTHSGLMILNRPLTNTETKNVIKYLYQKGTR